MATSIRPAIPDDARAIAAVHVASWRSAYRDLLPEQVLAGLSIEEREQMWRDGLAGEEPGSALVAEDARQIIGFVGFGPSRDDDAPDYLGEVYALYVLPERWRSGLGRRLLEEAERSLREAGSEEARLWVLDTNEPAHRFYEAMGWRADGARRREHLEGLELSEVRYRRSLTAAPA